MGLSLDLSFQELTILCEPMPVGVAIHQDGSLFFANPALLAMLGYGGIDELLGLAPADLVHPDERAVVAERALSNAQGKLKPPLVERIRRKDGSYATVEVSGLPVTCRERAAVMVLFNDISVSQAADKVARENSMRFKAIFDSGMAAHAILDDQGRIMECNQEVARLLGVEHQDLAGRSFADFSETPEAFQQALQRASRQGEFQDQSAFRRQDGSAFPGAWSYRAAVLPGQNFLTVRDRTEQMRLEDDLRQAQKMEAIGQLAGGVSHDFNNVLMVIMGNCQLLMERTAGLPEAAERLDEIMRACESAAEVTRQLLTFSRRHAPSKVALDLNEKARQTKKMLSRLLSEEIRLDLRLEAEQAWVNEDPSHIEQILINLGVNARDAMPFGGQLIIGTREAVVGGTGLEGLPSLAAGPYVVLSVQDNGSGMSDDVRARIFEPFFTTKGVGSGTGLGLATVFGIVKGAGGAIRVQSDLGAGTLFEVYLPQRKPCSAPQKAAPPVPPPSLAGRERILLVEDEDALRETLKVALEDHGYAVVEAKDGAKALAAVAGFDEAPAAVISDVVMPGMNGFELVEALQREHGVTKALLMSGYTEPSLFREHPLVPRENVFRKPMRLEKLVGRLREVLDVARPGSPGPLKEG